MTNEDYLAGQAFGFHNSYSAPSPELSLSGGSGILVERVGPNQFMIGLQDSASDSKAAQDTLAAMLMTLTVRMSGKPLAYSLAGFQIHVGVAFQNFLEDRVGASYRLRLTVDEEDQYDRSLIVPSSEATFDADDRLTYVVDATSAWLAGDTLPIRFRVNNTDLKIELDQTHDQGFVGFDGDWIDLTDPEVPLTYEVRNNQLVRALDTDPVTYEYHNWSAVGLVGATRTLLDAGGLPTATVANGVFSLDDNGQPYRIDWDDAITWTKV